MTQRTATCSCGQLKAVSAATSDKISLCHCLECQKRTGGPFGIAVFFDEKDVAVSGKSTVHRRPADSGFDVLFHFCPGCGSTVYWYPLRKPGMIAVAYGAYADPAFPAPTQVVNTGTAHRWCEGII